MEDATEQKLVTIDDETTKVQVELDKEKEGSRPLVEQEGRSEPANELAANPQIRKFTSVSHKRVGHGGARRRDYRRDLPEATPWRRG